eukprot:scaffold5679_cov63-Cyclotella_meneghiniana.AAC.4
MLSDDDNRNNGQGMSRGTHVQQRGGRRRSKLTHMRSKKTGGSGQTDPSKLTTRALEQQGAVCLGWRMYSPANAKQPQRCQSPTDELPSLFRDL